MGRRDHDCPLECLTSGQGPPIHADGARGGRGEPRKDLHQRRLAPALWADEGHDSRVWETQGDIVQGPSVPPAGRVTHAVESDHERSLAVE